MSPDPLFIERIQHDKQSTKLNKSLERRATLMRQLCDAYLSILLLKVEMKSLASKSSQQQQNLGFILIFALPWTPFEQCTELHLSYENERGSAANECRESDIFHICERSVLEHRKYKLYMGAAVRYFCSVLLFFVPLLAHDSRHIHYTHTLKTLSLAYIRWVGAKVGWFCCVHAALRFSKSDPHREGRGWIHIG